MEILSTLFPERHLPEADRLFTLDALLTAAESRDPLSV